MRGMPGIQNEDGFTLVEIIAVLILLGILAAVAIPRYADLQDQARTSAAQAAISEMMAQASTGYGKVLLANSGATPAIASIMAEMTTNIGDFTVSMTGTSSQIVFTVSAVQDTALKSNVVDTWTRPEQNKLSNSRTTNLIKKNGGIR